MMSVDVSTIGRVGVLYGGTSAERAVSLDSGQAMFTALKNAGVNAVAIDVQDNIIEQITAANIDFAFIALHGGIGEDGRLQSLLDFMHIPYSGSGVQASVVAMNKCLSKQIWQGIQLPTSPFAVLDQNTDFAKTLEQLGGSVIVKPAHEGSSIGMALAHNVDELERAYNNALQYGTSVFAEKLLTGGEYTVAILNGEPLPAIKLETDHSFYDYDAKYIANDTRYLCPCGLSVQQEQQLQALAIQAFDSLQCRGWGRVDIMMDAQGDFQLLEVNTVPGMTSHSLVPMAAKAAGYTFDQLVLNILTDSIKHSSKYAESTL